MPLFGLVVVAASIYWVWPALPFQDLPGHAGMIALRQRIDTSAFDQTYFVHAPRLGPYSVFRALGSLFASVLGPLGAVRLLATLPMFALPASVLFSRRLLFGSTGPAQGYLAVLLSFGFMTIYGFASYNLAIAVLVLAVSVHVALLESTKVEERSRLRIFVALLSVTLYLSHGFAFCAALLAVFAASIVGGREALFLRLRSLLLWLPGIVVFAYSTLVERFGSLPADAKIPYVNPVPYYDGVLGKLSLLLTPTLMTRTGVDVVFGIILWIALATAVIRARRTLSGIARRTLAGVLALFSVFCILPHGIGWFGFIDGRLAPLLLLLPIVALGDDAWPRWFLRWVAPTLGIAATLYAHVCTFRFQAEAAGHREVLQAVPAKARLLSLMVNPDSKVFTTSPFTHYDKLVLVDRECVPSAMWFHQGTALYPTAKNPVLNLPVDYHEADIGHVDWTKFRLEDWDYVFMRRLPEFGPPEVPPSLTTVSQSGSFWLFRVNNHAAL